MAIGPLVGFALGAMLAWWCRREAPRDEHALARARHGVAVLLGLVVFAPACAFFMLFAGDWALFYLADSRSVPSALLLLVVLVDAASVLGGFAAAYRAARANVEGTALLAIAGAPIALSLVIVAGFFAPLRLDGTFHQVSAGFGTRAVASGPLGLSVAWSWACIAVAALVAVRALDPQTSASGAPTPSGGRSL